MQGVRKTDQATYRLRLRGSVTRGPEATVMGVAVGVGAVVTLVRWGLPWVASFLLVETRLGQVLVWR